MRELTLPEIELVSGADRHVGWVVTSNGQLLNSGTYHFEGGGGGSGFYTSWETDGGYNESVDVDDYIEDQIDAAGECDSADVINGTGASQTLGVVIDATFSTTEQAAINSVMSTVSDHERLTFTDPVTGHNVLFGVLLDTIENASATSGAGDKIYIGKFSGDGTGSAGGNGYVNDPCSNYDGAVALGVIPELASAAHSSGSLTDDMGVVLIHEMLHKYLELKHGVGGYEYEISGLDNAIWDEMVSTPAQAPLPNPGNWPGGPR